MCLFICGCVATINTSIPQHKMTGPEMAKTLTNESVALVLVVPSKNPIKYKDKVYTYCSGVFIKADVIMTANHCISGYAKMTDPKHQNDKDDSDDKEIKIPSDIRLSYVVQSETFSPGMHPKAIHYARLLYHNHEQDLALLRIMMIAHYQCMVLHPLQKQIQRLGNNYI